jgi:hypothetical protein
LLKPEKINGGKCYGGGAGLQRHHKHGLFWAARQPPDGKEYQEWQLCSHEQLPEMGRRPLINFTGSAEDGDVSKHDRERGKRHCHGNKGARPFKHSLNSHRSFTLCHKANCVKDRSSKLPFGDRRVIEFNLSNSCGEREGAVTLFQADQKREWFTFRTQDSVVVAAERQ